MSDAAGRAGRTPDAVPVGAVPVGAVPVGAVPVGAVPVDTALTDRDREILAFERQWWRYAGAKEHAVREHFDMSATRYYQVLNALIDRRESLEFDPLLVKRLRRMRQTRQRARSARRLGVDT